jgi:hypothetical protein
MAVITDHAGNIVGTFQAVRGSKDAPSIVRIRAGAGQRVHELELADNLAAPEVVAKLHSTHRVDMTAQGVRLVDNNG